MGLGQDVCFIRIDAEITAARYLLDEVHRLAEAGNWEGALTVTQFDLHESYERLLALADDGREVGEEDDE